MLDKKDLKKIRNKLPYKYAEELSKRTGQTPDYVRMIMNGYKEDYHGVIKAAVNWIKELKEEKKQIRDAIR
ncbi:MAG: hypothetical protein ACOC8S_08075 [Bacteroidota bacterium]